MSSKNPEENLAIENENIVANLSRRSLQLDDVIDDLGKYMSTENEESDCENKEESLLILSDKENNIIDSAKKLSQDASTCKSNSDDNSSDDNIENIPSEVEVDSPMNKLTENESHLPLKSINEFDDELKSYQNEEEKLSTDSQQEENDNKDDCHEEVTKEEFPCEEEMKSVDENEFDDAANTTNQLENQNDSHHERITMPEPSSGLDEANDDRQGEAESQPTDDKKDISLKENQSPTFTDDEKNNSDDTDRENDTNDTKNNNEPENKLESKEDDSLLSGGFDVSEEHITDKNPNVEIKHEDISNSSINKDEAVDCIHEVNSEKSNDNHQTIHLDEISTDKDQQSTDHIEDQDSAHEFDKDEDLNLGPDIVEATEEKKDLSERNLEDNKNGTKVFQDEVLLKESNKKKDELQTDVFVDSVSCCETKGQHTCEHQVDGTLQSDDLDDDIEALLANLDGLDLDNDELANDLLNDFDPKTKDIGEVKKYKFKICTSLASMDRHMVSRTNKIISILLAQEEITEEHLELCDIGTDESYKKLWYRKAIDAANRNALSLPGIFRENGAGNEDMFIGNYEMIYDYNEQFTIEEHLWPEIKDETNEEDESNSILMRLLGKKM